MSSEEDLPVASRRTQVNLDAVLEAVGPFGRFQRVIYLLLCLPAIITAYITLASVFTTATPKYRCFVPHCDSENNPEYSDALEFGNFSLPSDETEAQCNRFAYKADVHQGDCSADAFDQTKEVRCDRWVYDDHIYKTSIVTDWNLVCDDKWKDPLTESIFFAGVLVGAVFFGVFADKFGRKLSFMLGTLLMVVAGLGLSLSNNYVTYVSLQFMAAFGQLGTFQTAFILAVEFVGKDYRVFCGIIIEYFFVLGECLLALVAYLSREWRHILLYVMAPASVFLLYWPIIPESVRWLLTMKKSAEAQKVIDRVAHWNKKPCVKLDDFREEAPAVVTDSLWDWVKSKTLMARTINIFYAWMVVTMTFYGLSMSSASLAGGAYLNFLLVSLVEIPGYTLSYWSMQRLGRKPSMAGSLLIGGVSLFVGAFATSVDWLNIACFLIGKLGTTCAFGTIYLYTSELYPTSIRTVGVGSSSMFGRIGAIISPYVGQLSSVASWLPMCVFGSNAIVCGLLILLLPETLGRELPETITDALNISERIVVASGTENGDTPSAQEPENPEGQSQSSETDAVESDQEPLLSCLSRSPRGNNS